MSEPESEVPFYRVTVNIYVTANDAKDAKVLVKDMMLGKEQMSKNWNISNGERV